MGVAKNISSAAGECVRNGVDAVPVFYHKEDRNLYIKSYKNYILFDSEENKDDNCQSG